MHKIFIAQKSYCACRVLSLATIRSKYYFNFILNRTQSGRELFDRPPYIEENLIDLNHDVVVAGSNMPFNTLYVMVETIFPTNLLICAKLPANHLADTNKTVHK